MKRLALSSEGGERCQEERTSLPVHKVPRQVAEHLSMMYGVHHEVREVVC
jgi:hypothetical protein